MVEVIINASEPLERALRRFKKKYEKAGILKDIKKNEFYVKPCAQKRLRRANAAKRLHRMIIFQDNLQS